MSSGENTQERYGSVEPEKPGTRLFYTLHYEPVSGERSHGSQLSGRKSAKVHHHVSPYVYTLLWQLGQNVLLTTVASYLVCVGEGVFLVWSDTLRTSIVLCLLGVATAMPAGFERCRSVWHWSQRPRLVGAFGLARRIVSPGESRGCSARTGVHKNTEGRKTRDHYS